MCNMIRVLRISRSDNVRETFGKMQNNTPFAPKYREVYPLVPIFIPKDVASRGMFSANPVRHVHAMALTIPEACRHICFKGFAH